jgi:hypothetical protein
VLPLQAQDLLIEAEASPSKQREELRKDEIHELEELRRLFNERIRRIFGAEQS